jgi:hypothetical protein
MSGFTDFCELLACVFLGVLAVILLFKIATDKIDLEWLISEDNGHASMSRFQLLIFTFVIAISLVKLTEKLGDHFPPIDSGILTLLGISASTYAVGKGIQKSGGDSEPPAQNSPKAGNPANAPAASGATDSAAQRARDAASEAARHAETARKAAQVAVASAGKTQDADGELGRPE